MNKNIYSGRTKYSARTKYSIAHGQIGDSISQKNWIFEKLFFTKDKKWYI